MLIAVVDDSDIAEEVRRVLRGAKTVQYVPVGSSFRPLRDGRSVWLLAIDLGNASAVKQAIRTLGGRPIADRLIAVVPDLSWQLQVQSATFGASKTIPADAIAGLISDPAVMEHLVDLPPAAKTHRPVAEAMTHLVMTLNTAFADQPPISTDPRTVLTVDRTVQAIRTVGVDAWSEAVSAYADKTLTHTMLVMSYAIGLGLSSGLNAGKLQKVGAGSLLHDIGKREIPVSLVDKLGPLSRQEFEIIALHPVVGERLLTMAGERDRDILSIVLSHHEMLDGSGYPNGIGEAAIPSLTRLVTVADIYAALVEERPGKPGLTPAKAYEHLTKLGRRLDRSYVSQFKSVALAQAA